MRSRFTGVKVFSAAVVRDRANLDITVNRWIADNPKLGIVDIIVRQSSDSEMHCVSIIIFWRER